MRLNVTKTVTIALISIVTIGVVVKQKISASPSADNVLSQKQKNPNISQGLKAYIDPVTGKLISTPPTGESSLEGHLSAELGIAPNEGNVFPETQHEDGSFSIDTSALINPLMAVEGSDGKIHIGHNLTPNASKEVK